MTRSVSSRRRRRQDRKGYALIIVVLLMMCAVMLGYFRLKGARVQLDEVTLCPRDFPPSEIHAVLIDRTDPMTVIQRASVRHHLESIKSQTPQYGAIELYTVGPIKDELIQADIRICNPGKGEDVNALFGNPEMVKRKWRNEFSQKIDDVFDKILTTDAANESPIMEGIQSIAISAFGTPGESAVPLKMTIVSDMLHHTSEFSQYQGDLAFGDFRQSHYYKQVRPRLDGVEVTILYLRRSTTNSIQGRAHIEFWQKFVGAAGGVVTGVTAVTG